MMITIHGLPLGTKYHEVKSLIKQECNISEFILDYLTVDTDTSKKVRVGLADDAEGSHLIKCLDGYRMGGNVLNLVPFGKSAAANTQQPNTYDTRGSHQRTDYPTQYNDRSAPPVESRPAPWAANSHQWSPNPIPQQAPMQNSYGHQQQTIANSYVQQAKPHFEPREVIPAGRASQSQSFGFAPKSNLISLGPQNNMSNLREIPQALTRPTQPGRYSSQNYDISSEKPITIMKDNFQRPSQYNVTSNQNLGSNFSSQNQTSPWATQHQQQKSYEPSLPTFDKKSYDDRKSYEDRKYADQMKPTSDMLKSDDHYKYEKGGRDFSPQRRDFRDIEPGRRVSPSRQAHSSRQMPYSDRQISPERRVQPPTGRRISPARRISPSGRHMSSSNRRDSPSGRQISPSGRHVSLVSRHVSPPGRRVSPSGRRVSPSGRRVSPSGRCVSPSVRRVSPSGRRVSPSGRRVSPSGRRVSPSGRRVSPSDRHISSSGPVKHIGDRRFSPSGRQIPIQRKLSPHMRKEEYIRGRRISPPLHSPMDRRSNHQSPGRETGILSHRQESPRRQARYSPSRHHGNKQMEYQDDRGGNIKDVRPAYEPQSQASNEAMYSGGYRSNVRNEAKYHSRQENWQDREKFSSKSDIDDRREVPRMQKFDISRDQQQSTELDLKRSRSPKRDRSPLRDRYKRHSPSPRSPRRSWALEKRRSPEIREPPPPPIWPQEREEYAQKSRPKFPDSGMEKNSPIWETRENKCDDFQSIGVRRNFEETRRKEVIPKWKPISTSTPPQSSSFSNLESSKDSKFTRGFDRDNDTRITQSDIYEKEYRQERDDLRYKPAFEKKDEMPRKKDQYSGRIEEKKKAILEKQEQLQKEIDEVYKRAVDFAKKAEMYRKSEHKKESNLDEDRHSAESHGDIKDYQRKREAYDETRHGDESENTQKLRFVVNSAVKSKRTKAAEEIAEKIISKYGSSLPKEVRYRVRGELEHSLGRKLFDMFDNTDVSFIEMVVKFNARLSQKDEEKIFNDVLSSLPSQYRNLKRFTQDESDIPTKSSRRSPEPNLIKDDTGSTVGEHRIPDWDIGTLPQSIPLAQPMSIITTPVMVPLPAQYQFIPTYPEMPQVVEEPKKDGYTLYLCKDNFQPIFEYETDQLKNFLIQKLIKVTETSQGWAPDFTLNKQHSTYRHEVLTRDERSKDWLLNLDFSEFTNFNVLVYTTEELWYERAAIWLPGHSRCRNIEPLVKLKLQNRNVEGVNIGKWKIVKKIVTEKGTRLYVDMPPASARALERNKMTLSFELQKVNVFLKAVAIDKNAFDAGLSEPSIEVLPSPGSASMPSISDHPDLVKMAFKGNKPLPLTMARKLKDIIIYKLFKYHELNGKSRTDFLKYGLCQGGYFGILPENEESKRWLCALDMGKINRVPIIILGADGTKTKYFKMMIIMPKDYQLNTSLALERIRQSNRGVKGLNFNLWKNQNLVINKKDRVTLEIDMDYESVVTLSKMKYQLDYVVNGISNNSLNVESGYSNSKLEELLAKYKAEISDSYEPANMDIATDSEEEVICLD